MARAHDLILRSLAAGSRTMWDLVAEQNTQHRRFTTALRELLSAGLVQHDRAGLCSLTMRGQQVAADRGLIGWQDATCPTCRGQAVVVPAELAELEERFRRLSAGRPEITTEFDQGVVPPGVALERVALMEQRGDLHGRSLLVVGDDDLMSVAFKLRGKVQRIVVLEIDTRITGFLRQVVAREGWHDVDIYDYDVRSPLPRVLHDQFDVFFTDPVETVRGITLFLSRCAQALHEDGCGYFGLTHLESGWAKWLAVERAAVEMNLAIAEVLKDFSHYLFQGQDVLRGAMKIVAEAPVPLPPPDRPWFSSTLFRVQAVGKPRPKILGAVAWGRELYADEDTI